MTSFLQTVVRPTRRGRGSMERLLRRCASIPTLRMKQRREESGTRKIKCVRWDGAEGCATRLTKKDASAK